jgi:DNA-binding SARP family transcriptional activator/predicted ATPase
VNLAYICARQEIAVQRDDARDTARAASLEIYLLGTPKISLNGAPVAGLTSVKAQALLFYLAVTGRSHTRSALAALLWGDVPDAASRASLRKALQQLRRSVTAYLAVEHDTIALRTGTDTWVDVVAFDAAFHNGPDSDPDRLRSAVDLYRGDFLEGFYVRDAADFEDWWLAERARLRERMLGGLHALAQYRAGQGDLPGAIAYIRRLLNIEPWRELAQRNLMTWLAQDGQRSAALAQYEICRRVLADELAVEPAAETIALHERIRKGDLGPPLRSTEPAVDVEPYRPAFLDRDAQATTSQPEPFVGREPHLARLAGLLETALAGRGQVAFVSGEAGWGKTSLVDEFSRRAEALHADLIVASGTCTAFTESGDPYLPFREILRTLCADVEQKWDAGRITRTQALRLWHLLPQTVDALLAQGRHLIDTFVPGVALLRRTAGHEAADPDLLKGLEELVARPRPDAGVDQGRIFEEIDQVLRAISGERPLLLILDDLHWVDPSSLALLFHLGRRLADSRILIVGTYRPEDISLDRGGQVHPLAGILAEFKRVFGDVWIPLGQDRDDGRAFVDALLDSEPNRLSERFRAQLARDTNGHPLFAVKMLRDMEDRGYVYRDENGLWIDSPTIAWDTLPRRVEGVIERRVSRLEPRLRDALAAASVEGEEFSAEVLARVRQIDAREMVRLLSTDLNRRHRLVRASGTQWLGDVRISHYHFSHNLFQKYLYQSLDPVERTYLHEAVGYALEAFYRDRTEKIAVHLARHFQEAGRPRKAIEYLRQAGDASAEVYAYAEAIAHYRQAIDLARETELAAEDLTLLYMRLGSVLEVDSQYDRALATYEEMERVAHSRGDAPMELAWLMARATIQWVPTAVHDPEQARILGSRALMLASELGDQAAVARILWALSLASFFMNRLDAAIDCGERSLALARRLGLQEQTAYTLNDLGGFVYLYSGRIDQAIEALQKACVLWRDLGDSRMLADSLAKLCTAHVYAGEYERAISLSQTAFEFSQSIRDVWAQSYSRWTIGDAYRARGEYSQAIEASETCIRMGELAGFLPGQIYTRLKLASIYGDLGEVERGIQLAQMALDQAERQLPTHVALALGILAHLLVLQGDLGRAEQALGEAHKRAACEAWAVFYLDVLTAEAELGLRLGDFGRALDAAENLLGRLRRYNMRSGLPEAYYLQGEALLASGQRERAREQLLEARRVAEELGSRRMLWRVLSALAELESEPAVAGRLRNQAQELVEAIASEVEPENLQRLFLDQPDVRAILQDN